MNSVPASRIRALNGAPPRHTGDWVVYWMIASRRLEHNFALARAVDWARELARPLLILEALRCDYPHASDRLHRFVLDGMAEHHQRLEGSRVRYYPYVERQRGGGKGLLEELGRRAALVVTDDYPCFFVPRMVAAAGERLAVKLEAVDSHGLLPLRAAERVFHRAVDFRRFLQKTLPRHLEAFPRRYPLTGEPLTPGPELAASLRERWPPAYDLLTAGSLASLPIDHAVPPVSYRGGTKPAREQLDRFLARALSRYAEESGRVEAEATSALSPYLHFGHLGVHGVFESLAEREGWSPDRLGETARGQREGWWGMPRNAEAFVDQLVTWRELGANFCVQRSDYAEYGSLPEWARRTLQKHAADERPYLYTLPELEEGRTHDEVWNAAQGELRQDGRIHNYLRMVWGKKILEWSPTPHEALRRMIELNDRYAVDGRDPNSYSGILWCLGRYDRPWGPERPVFGTVRYMSTASTRRKMSLQRYLRTYVEASRDPHGSVP